MAPNDNLRNVAFLGAGNMGSAIIKGVLRKKFLSKNQIQVFDIDPNKSTSLSSKYGVGTPASSIEAIQGCDYIFLCVKPQQFDALLSEIKGNIEDDQCIISIAAGITTQQIEERLKSDGFAPPVIRVMPNTPALVNSGMTVITRGKHSTPENLQFAKDLFKAVGKVQVLDEKYFDAITAISGSGPAYLFFLAEAFEKAAVELEIPPEYAISLVRTVINGSTKLLKSRNSAEDLRQKVTSPGGTTEAAINYLKLMKWDTVFIEAVKKAKERSEELRKRS